MQKTNQKTNQKPLRVLITGVTTPLGQKIVHKILNSHPESIVIGVGFEDHFSIHSENQERFHYRKVDLTKPRNVRNLLFGEGIEKKIESILDMASHRSILETGKKVHSLNVELTRNLLSCCNEHSIIRHFVYKSISDVYESNSQLPLFMDEQHPIRFSPHLPQWLRDRVEADFLVCSQMGVSKTQLSVVRHTEILSPHLGSQLFDYLRSKVCFRALGFDPILNLVSLEDLSEAFFLCLQHQKQGVFNVSGCDILPLSKVIQFSKRVELPVPELFLSLLYKSRQKVLHTDFHYKMNASRFHFGTVLCGKKAEKEWGYKPRHRINWKEVQEALNSFR